MEASNDGSTSLCFICAKPFAKFKYFIFSYKDVKKIISSKIDKIFILSYKMGF